MGNEDPALASALVNQARLYKQASERPVGSDGKVRKEETIDARIFHRGALNAGKDGQPDYSCWSDEGYKRDMNKRFKFRVPQPATRPTFGYHHVSPDRWPFQTKRPG